MQTVNRIKEVKLSFSLKADSNSFLTESCADTMHYRLVSLLRLLLMS